MKNKTRLLISLLTVSVVAFFITGCATTTPTQFYRPANFSGEPYRISGKLESMSGWNGVVTITINEKEVIKKPLPLFSNTVDAQGDFEGKKILVTITQVENLTSTFTRADVFIGAERAASLTF